MVMWGTQKDRPDFGGKETDDIRYVHYQAVVSENASRTNQKGRYGVHECSRRLIAEDEEKVLQINNPGFYSTCTVHVEVDFLAVCAILLHQHLSDGISNATSFERAPQVYSLLG